MNEERDPVELSRRLVYLAAERTLAFWGRTGVRHGIYLGVIFSFVLALIGIALIVLLSVILS